MFAVEGYKDVSIDLTGEDTAAPYFTGIVGGIETAQLTNDELDYSAYDVSGTLNLATVGGSVNFIADDAFEGDHVVFFGQADSYAQTYANSQGIPFFPAD